MQAAAAAVPRRPKHCVEYKSSALQATAPHLVASATSDTVSATHAIQNAAKVAEQVRQSFKDRRHLAADHPTTSASPSDNAHKYERRLHLNRKSAAASRVRREAYTKALEAELVAMEAKFNHMASRLRHSQQITDALQQTTPLRAAHSTPVTTATSAVADAPAAAAAVAVAVAVPVVAVPSLSADHSYASSYGSATKQEYLQQHSQISTDGLADVAAVLKQEHTLYSEQHPSMPHHLLAPPQLDTSFFPDDELDIYPDLEAMDSLPVPESLPDCFQLPPNRADHLDLL